MIKHLHATKAVIENQLFDNACVKTKDGLISAISYLCNENADTNLIGTLIPGFVDIHCHGGGGFYFSNPDINSIKAARETHLQHGTTSLLASLVTEPIGVLEEQIHRLIPLVLAGVFAGIHLEGPYLAEARCGAHQPTLLRSPRIDELSALIDAGFGTISMVTLAPELDGAIEAIEYLVSRGVVVALGHTQADATTTERALKAGAKLITHFSNGMPKPSEGHGTITSFALEQKDLPLEMIFDKVHFSDETLNVVKDSGEDRIILITDAMSAAGQPDGKYTIGALAVTVTDGVARLDSNGSLAGSTLTMDKAFLNLLDSGSSIVEAVYAASTLPAETVGLHQVGSIAVGKSADLLLVTQENQITLIEI